MRRERNTKIVATVGPASSSRDMLKRLFVAGVDVFRLNMSHGTHDEVAERHRLIREIELEMGRPIGILVDLQGPKLRVGMFAEGAVELEDGQSFRFDLDEAPGDKTRVNLPHPEIFAAIGPGATLLVNDGKIRLHVVACDDRSAACEVMAGGTISNHKGVNLPHVVLPIAAVTEKDKADLEFVLGLGIDWLALSFVQRPEDVADARKLMGERQVAVMVKVEKPAAVKRFDEILAVVDGIMVARGDLGVEMMSWELPPIQKHMIRRCRQEAKPVIVATQMLESMIDSPQPTRAEVSDVATAIYDGADAVMLSAESAAGHYPVEAVEMMNNVARHVEADEGFRRSLEAGPELQRRTVADAITAAARQVAEFDGCQGALLLHAFRHDRPAGGARAADGADPGADADGRHGAAADAHMGAALRADADGRTLQDGRGAGGAGLPRLRLRQRARQHHRHRRRAVQPGRHDEHPARGASRRAQDLRGRAGVAAAALRFVDSGRPLFGNAVEKHPVEVAIGS